ncbi:hypothetical protein V7127_06010, partial [Bacillus sp. JJ1773]|uniref:hypothetical protein n=1 Tax=Bacillus sp. JJ1773 TaxID=3122965 RepID=UPI002FFE3166
NSAEQSLVASSNAGNMKKSIPSHQNPALLLSLLKNIEGACPRCSSLPDLGHARLFEQALLFNNLQFFRESR